MIAVLVVRCSVAHPRVGPLPLRRGADFGPAQSTSGVDTVVREVLVEETDKDLVKVKEYVTDGASMASTCACGCGLRWGLTT